MTIRPDLLLAHDFGVQRQAYGARDAILYALGVGLGLGTPQEADLPFLDETRLRVLPSFAITLGSPGMWIRDSKFGVDFARLVHSEQSARFHAPLPGSGEVESRARILSLLDRGEGRGAVLTLERSISDASDGTLYCNLEQTLLLRGDGGFGGEPAPRLASIASERTPDMTSAVTLSRRAALIYRLTGDWNPLHIDPDFARNAGFERPIMHGLGTYATAGIAVARACGRSASQISELACRFSGTVYPGDTLELSIWHGEGTTLFRTQVGDRTVLDEGRIAFREEA